jgi:hypothetical protein
VISRRGARRGRTIALLVLTTACATVTGVRTAPLDLGRGRVFRATPERALAATKVSFARMEIVLDTLTHPDSVTWLVMGTHPGGFGAGSGEVVRVVGRPVSDSTTEVRVLTKRYNPTDVWGTGDWAPRFFIYLGAFLGDSGIAAASSK